MKPFLLLVIWALFGTLTACTNLKAAVPTPTSVPRGPEILGVFEGVTPCSGYTQPLPQVPTDSDCEQMIWSLVLYRDAQTGSPSTYQLKSAYGMPKPNTNDLVKGGTPIEMEGAWTITTGTRSDPNAVVYQLNPDDSQMTVSFLRVSDDLIHVLSRENTLLVGNGAWSYTLNRMDNQTPAQVSAGSPPEPPTRPPTPPIPDGSSVFGVFDGRTPCDEMVIEFTGNAPYPGCLKIKWRLTLYQDEATGEPTTYLFMGTSHYREGTWKIINGFEDDPDAVIYQLSVNDSAQPVSFLRVDENHLFLMDREMNLLVGNQWFSYTLSRNPNP